MGSAAEVIDSWLAPAPAEARAWLSQRVSEIAGGSERALFLAFGPAARQFGKAPLALDDMQLEQARRLWPGLECASWSLDQAARVRLVLALRAEPAAAWLASLDRLFAAADLGELIALYQALALMPHPEALRLRAAEGVRSNMRAVFEAVALSNPFPERWLDEAAFNQLVLKCLFVGSRIDRVVGLDRRANPRLASMLVDYAHERWAAKRAVDPLLWRAVGAHGDAAVIEDLGRVLASGIAVEREAAALALAAHPGERPRALLAGAPALAAAITAGTLSWASLGDALTAAAGAD